MAITGLEHRVMNTVGNEEWLRDSGLPLHQMVQFVSLATSLNVIVSIWYITNLSGWWLSDGKGQLLPGTCRQQPRRSISGDKHHWVIDSRTLIIICFQNFIYVSSFHC
jgi:hypothetical protein